MTKNILKVLLLSLILVVGVACEKEEKKVEQPAPVAAEKDLSERAAALAEDAKELAKEAAEIAEEKAAEIAKEAAKLIDEKSAELKELGDKAVVVVGEHAKEIGGKITEIGNTISKATDSDHSPENALDWGGTYKGLVINAAGEEMETELTLDYNNSYTYKTISTKENKIYEKKGTLKWTNVNTIELDTDGAKTYFTVGENHLELRDVNGNKIDTKDNHILEKDPDEFTEVDSDHSPENALDWNGTYKGLVISAAGEEMETELTLALDNSYTYKTISTKENKVYEKKGTLKWTNVNTIELDTDGAKTYFTVGENYLELRDANGNKIDTKDNHILEKDPDEFTEVDSDHSPESALDWDGKYKGLVIDAAGKEKEIELTLALDNSYTYKSTKGNSIFEETGTFKWTNVNTIELNTFGGRTYFTVGENYLELRDANGNKIDTKDNHILEKLQ